MENTPVKKPQGQVTATFIEKVGVPVIWLAIGYALGWTSKKKAS